ncbi:Homoserine kinase [Sulfitobacter noctilucicola]|uniref:Hydroxylysine kinase n=1 Tax=Sulfitobacter noctilucicola TaxID=1342301 RepID=A0A7W6M9G3_9RHOB|nr:phosphotransferase [Sulfitobacter noctilucicola]KIN63591.1 Homoserine kinase [Sulfitobacter noctilucicola]MBB4174896.1 Ser/Thr protein kinase RdoA (MazF antagonist) [Sulfitobacter noctilucicola]
MIRAAGKSDLHSELLSHDAPDISAARAAEIARDVFGVAGTVKCLTAEKDANFCIRPDGGNPLLLKISNAAEARGVIDMQTAALIHLQSVDPSLPVPQVYNALNGNTAQLVLGADGREHVVRMLSFLEGRVLSNGPVADGVHREIGALLARLNVAMRGFAHPSADHVLQWDIKQASLLRPMLPAIQDSDLHKRLTALIDRFDLKIAPKLSQQRAQVVHNDFNPHNLLVNDIGAPYLSGIIDFGDMVHTHIACDLAVACAYQIAHGAEPLFHIAQILRGYSSVLSLEEPEIDLLPELICLRHATTLIIGAMRAKRYPENAAYILRNSNNALHGLAAMDLLGIEAARDVLHRAAQPNERSEPK